MNIAIIGGGAAGLATAWLLEHNNNVILFEHQKHLGGHAQTVYLTQEHGTVPIELGFEFFNSTSFPCFIRLLEILHVQIKQYPITYTFYTPHRVLRFPPFQHGSSAWSLCNPSYVSTLAQLMLVIALGKQFLKTKNRSTTLEQLLDSFWTTQDFKNNFFYPFVAAGWGISINDFKKFAAYDIFTWLTQKMIRITPSIWCEIVGGTSLYIQKLVNQLTRTTIKQANPITRIIFEQQKYHIMQCDGTVTQADHLVIATNPQNAYTLLEQITHAQPARTALQKIISFSTTIAIHGDYRLMPTHRKDWSTLNIRFNGSWSALSIYKPWISKNIFRSWITHHENQPYVSLPEPLYAIKHFRHQQVTPDYFQSQTILNELQGINNLWFAGHYLHGIDSHENALISALKISKRLDCYSQRGELFTDVLEI